MQAGQPLAHEPGPANIEVTLDGFVPRTERVQLSAGQPMVQPVHLEKAAPQSFNVLIKTSPMGADIYEDARKVGTSPKLVAIQKGDHHLSFRLAGYKETAGSLSATKEGEEFEFELKKNEQAPKPQQKPQISDLKEER